LCRQVRLNGGGTTAETYCVAPCRLTSCAVGAFSYSCGSGSYSSSTDYDYTTPSTTVNTHVAYSNGHTVDCTGTAESGSCNDDSGASCSW
jgi:hypothetical protein